MLKQANWRELRLIALIAVPWLIPAGQGALSDFYRWMTTGLCLLFLWLWGWRRRVITVRVISLGLLTAALLNCFIALLQYFLFAEFFRPWLMASAMGQAYGNLGQRNHLATLASMGLVALLWLAGPQRSRPFSAFSRWMFAAGIVLAAGNAVSASRTGMLQWGAIMMLAFWWSAGTDRAILGFAAKVTAFYLFFTALLPYLLWLVSGFEAESLANRVINAGSDSRRVLWANMLHLISLKPWLGWGWGELQFAHFVTIYPDQRFPGLLDNAHNLPLHLAVTLGLPITLTLCGGGVGVILYTRPWRDTDPGRQMLWTIIAMIGIHSLVEYPLWYAPFQMTLLSCVVSLFGVRYGSMVEKPLDFGQVLNKRVPATRQAATRSTLKLMAPLTASLLLLLMALISWDFHRASQIYLPVVHRAPAYKEDTLSKSKNNIFFKQQTDFAELFLTDVTLENAGLMYAIAKTQLRHSPEPQVIEKLIESARLLDLIDEVYFYEKRFQLAYPNSYRSWQLRAKSKTF